MKQLPAENKSPVLINHGCDYSAQSVALTLNTHLPCKLTQIPLYSSIYRLAEPTCSSTRPKSPGGGRQEECHPLLPLLWQQIRNSCPCAYLQKECPQSMGACFWQSLYWVLLLQILQVELEERMPCWLQPLMQAAGLSTAALLQARIPRGWIPTWIAFPISLWVGRTAGGSSQQCEAEGRCVRDTVGEEVSGEAKSVSQHFPLMLPAVTVSDSQGVPATLLLLCISLSPSIWLERSATLVTGWAISTSISYGLGDLGI